MLYPESHFFHTLLCHHVLKTHIVFATMFKKHIMFILLDTENLLQSTKYVPDFLLQPKAHKLN